MTRKFYTCIFFIFAVTLIASSGRQAAAQVVKESSSEKMLREIKAIYKPFQGKDSFLVSYTGKELKDISIITVEVGPAISIMADVAAGRELDLTPEIMRKLLEFNTRADYIKVGISDIGSIRVQSEQTLVTMNSNFFKAILDQVASGADEIAMILRPAKKKTAVPVK
jgi:hypothetical protein